jgi:hypothetical protein
MACLEMNFIELAVKQNRRDASQEQHCEEEGIDVLFEDRAASPRCDWAGDISVTHNGPPQPAKCKQACDSEMKSNIWIKEEA